MTDDRHSQPGTGFFEALLDLSFTEFITPRVVATAYVIAQIVAALGAVGVGVFVAMAFREDSEPVRAYVVGPVVAVIALVVFTVLVRLASEWAVLFFRIGEFSRDQVDTLDFIADEVQRISGRLQAEEQEGPQNP